MKPARYVAAAFAVLAIAVGTYLSFGGAGPRGAAPQVGYTLLDGTRGDTAQLRGKVVLMNFWATSCSVCMQEMPQIVATHEKFKARGYETLAVAMSYDPPASVAQRSRFTREVSCSARYATWNVRSPWPRHCSVTVPRSCV